jgi:hypothetical protein
MSTIAGQLLNVFTPVEINNIIKLLKHIPNQRNPNQSGDILNNGFTENDLIYPAIKEIVIQKINQVSPVKITQISVGMQLIARDPYRVHTDFLDKNDNGFGYGFLIPLYTTPSSTENSFTVVFNEGFTHSNQLKDYIDTNPPKPIPNAESIWHLLPEDPIEYAKYLSVCLVGKWLPGSVIYWDRRMFHSSDDFRLKGILEKSALVIFTSSNE